MRSLLFPSLSNAFFRELHTTSLSTCGLSRSYSQTDQVPSSKVTAKVPRSPAKTSRYSCCLRFQNGFHYYLAVGIHDGDRDRCLMHVQPNIHFIVHEGAPFCRS